MKNLLNYFTPRWFLLIGGGILLLLGVLGFIGVLGPTLDKSVFREAWWFDNAESIAHAVVGLLALVSAFVLPVMWQRYVVFAIAALGFFFGVYSIFMGPFGPATFQNPADTLLHIVFGIWALACAMNESEPVKPKQA